MENSVMTDSEQKSHLFPQHTAWFRVLLNMLLRLWSFSQVQTAQPMRKRLNPRSWSHAHFVFDLETIGLLSSANCIHEEEEMTHSKPIICSVRFWYGDSGASFQCKWHKWRGRRNGVWTNQQHDQSLGRAFHNSNAWWYQPKSGFDRWQLDRSIAN